MIYNLWGQKTLFDDIKDLKQRCLRLHQIALLKWVVGLLIFALTVIILASLVDNYFDTSAPYYHGIKMVALFFLLIPVFFVAGRLLYRIIARDWTYYMSDEERECYNDKMKEFDNTGNPPKSHQDNPPKSHHDLEGLDRFYSDERCIRLIVEASVDAGIIMVGGLVEVFYSTNNPPPPTPENTLSQMIIKRVIEGQFYQEKDIVYIDSCTFSNEGRSVKDYVESVLASDGGNHLLFVIDCFYCDGNLDTALMLSRLGHTVIALAHPHQSPFLSKTLYNALSDIEDCNRKTAMIGFLEETNLIVMRDSATKYRSLDLHAVATSRLVSRLCDKGESEVYDYMEYLTTSPQQPPPLRF